MELISHHQLEEFRKGQKETACVHPLPRIPLASIHLGWTMRAPPGKTELEWLAKDHRETNPITIKPETASHAARPKKQTRCYRIEFIDMGRCSWYILAAATAKSLQSCLTLSDPMDCSLPGSSIHGICQASVLKWGAIAFSSQFTNEL